MEKVWWKSRSVWIHGLVGLVPFTVGREWVHLPLSIKAMQIHAVIGLLLRFDTKGPLTLRKYAPKEESGP